MTHIWRHKLSLSNSSLLGCVISKIINNVLLVFSQSNHSIRFHWRLLIDTRWVMRLCKWPWTLHLCGWSLYECMSDRQAVNRNPDLDLYLHSYLQCFDTVGYVPQSFSNNFPPKFTFRDEAPTQSNSDRQYQSNEKLSILLDTKKRKSQTKS